jgi:alkylation response protein AidB-like acyl-CoA dehydrogenase
MDLELSLEQQRWRDSVRAYANEAIAPGSREREAAHAIPSQLIHEMGSRSLLGVNIPKAYGGAERGVVSYALSTREVGRADASVAVTMAVSNMVAEVIVQFGTPAQITRHVPRIASGEYFGGAFALSEPGSGSDAASLTTRAVHTTGGWILTGEKMWITTGDQAGVIVVWARTSDAPGAAGISCFLVEGGARGLSVGKPEEKMGLRASHTVSLSLDGVEVSDDALLGKLGGGFRIAMAALDGGRIGVASQSLGIGDAALARAREVARQSRPSGQKPADEQGVQFQLANVATELDAAWLLTLRAAWLKEQKRSFTRQAAMAKAFASEAANRAARSALEVSGHAGWLDDYTAARLLRDCRVTQIYEGTSEVQRLVISRDILKAGVLS